MALVEDGLRTTISVFEVMAGTAGAVIGYFTIQAFFAQGVGFLGQKLSSAGSTNGNRR